MSKVYQCDRCKATCDMAEQNDTKKFKAISIGLNNIHLCPHCMKKFEEFLSNPTCMENVEEPLSEAKEEAKPCVRCKHWLVPCHKGPCLVCRNHENWEPAESEEKSEEEEETYCTDCPYFEYVVDDTRSWYGGLCKKDGHESAPSMYAINSLHDNCPLKKGEN